MFDHFYPVYLKYIIMVESIIFVIICSVLLHHTVIHSGRKEAAEQRVEYYTSVQVNAGESLWEISRRYYSDEYKSMDSYIRRIMELNHMMNSQINAGAYLIIPYYHMQSLHKQDI